MPSTVGAGGSRDQIIRCSGWRPPAVIGSQPLPPRRLNEGGGGLTAAAELRGRGEAARVSDVDLEMGGRDVKATCAHIRPVGEARDLMLGFCHETKPLELCTEGVPHAVVSPGPHS